MEPDPRRRGPAAGYPGHDGAEALAERGIVGRPGDEVDVVCAGLAEPEPVAFAGLAPQALEQQLERTGRWARLGVEDADGHATNGRHGGESNDGSTTTMGDGRSAGRTVRAYIGLGANVGPAEETLARGVRALANLPGGTLRGVSRLYATEPWGVVDQPEFRNAVVALDVPAGGDPPAGATALLVALKDLERAFGRESRGRWGPREIDLDLLVFGRARVSTSRPEAGRPSDPAKAGLPLTVPHPLIGERLFVLEPLADLAPGLVPPGWRNGPRRGIGAADRRADGGSGDRPLVGGGGEMAAAGRRDGAARAARPGAPEPDARGRFRSNMWTVSTKRTCFVR
jgi:2-amino-4-hydroxy-6-hydroxymethyldihydropteridine diphosphokinase